MTNQPRPDLLIIKRASVQVLSGSGPMNSMP